MTAFRPYKPVLVTSAAAEDFYLFRSGVTVALEVGPSCDQTRLRESLPQMINGSLPFLLLLDVTDGTGPSSWSAWTAEALGLCLFSPHYLRAEGRPVVAVLGGPAPVPESAAVSHEGPASAYPALASSLEALGWGDVLIRPLSDAAFGEQLRQGQSPLLLRDTDPPIPDLRALFFSHWAYMGAYIFFRGQGAVQAQVLEEAFSASCADAVRREEGGALLAQALSAYMEGAARIAKMAEDQRVLEDRLKSAATILSVIRGKYKDDYDTLYSWHHSEYTVLPLWFKRLGQVVKVLTGKRTFRSLFDKNK